MRVAACLLLATMHALLAVALTGIAINAGTSPLIRLAYGTAALTTWVTMGVLAACPFTRLPRIAAAILRVWCIALPTLYFVGSLDSGMLSGQEFLLGASIVGLAWLTWRIFIWAKPPGPPIGA